MNFLKKQRGGAVVEMAIFLIPMVLLCFGITEFGRAIFQYNAIAKASRDAVRYLSQQGPGDVVEIGFAKCLAVHGNRTCTGSSLAPALTVAMVSVCDRSNCASHLSQSTGSGVINLVTVTITGYPFTSLVPFVAPNIMFGPISSTMRQVL